MSNTEANKRRRIKAHEARAQKQRLKPMRFNEAGDTVERGYARRVRRAAQFARQEI